MPRIRVEVAICSERDAPLCWLFSRGVFGCVLWTVFAFVFAASTPWFRGLVAFVSLRAELSGCAVFSKARYFERGLSGPALLTYVVRCLGC